MPKIQSPNPPLADVNVLPMKDGKIEIVACFKPDPDILVGEGETRVVLALDASRSIKEMFGGGVFGTTPNYVQIIAHKLGEMLSSVSRSGTVSIIYWALGPSGNQMELVGHLSSEEIQNTKIIGPNSKKFKWGGGTQMLPAVRFICDDIAAGADWTMGVIITDGIIEDEEACMKYCLQVGQDIANDKRGKIKLILIGVGAEVDEGQLERFDDMFETTNLKDEIDLWSHGVAASMQDEADILDVLFGELMTEEIIVASSGRVIDNAGKEVASWSDGLPGKIRFLLPKGSTSFSIQTSHGEFSQDITEVFGK